ncbi:MAG: FGGY family carbohydrate kinase [Peptoniphilaceae bacterium]|nr:FGGY family carbohydrate kinase [Peptoniphilaceae bacterium]MDD7382809.1 FGGY family carbohydrate kinase [Peptoniphilaceae bacterium]MDY3737966.1 FGGY family carbohydrate kinase [Peptoniphilaceae bacterium]
MKKVLAIDMGATSIRAILAYIENDSLKIEEVMRFSHDIVDDNNRKRWQFDLILKNITDTILKYKDEISSVAVDSWGVDFGFIKENELFENPISYRDPENSLGIEQSLEKKPLKDLFLETGNQINSINSFFQLLAYKKINNTNFKDFDTLLFIPDLINYFLCGAKKTDITMASTSQMLDMNLKKWNFKLLDEFDINKNMFTDFSKHGEIIGNTKNSKIEALKECDIDVVSIPAHDTAAAITMTKSNEDPNTMFLSSGTWTLFGVVADKAYINEKVFEKNLTNEIGFGEKNLLLKNITGLFVFEKFKKELEQIKGKKYTYEEIENICNEISLDGLEYFDIEDERFSSVEKSAIESIEEYLKETGQKISENKERYFKVIYYSIVKNLKKVKKDIEEVTAKTYKRIHIIGGGSKSKILCNLIKEMLGVDLIEGPQEATALGNIYVQIKKIYNLDSEKIDTIFNKYKKENL